MQNRLVLQKYGKWDYFICKAVPQNHLLLSTSEILPAQVLLSLRTVWTRIKASFCFPRLSGQLPAEQIGWAVVSSSVLAHNACISVARVRCSLSLICQHVHSCFLNTKYFSKYWIYSTLQQFSSLLGLFSFWYSNYNLLALLMLHQQNVGLNRKIKGKGNITFQIFLVETLKVLDGFVLIPLNHNSAASL